jgi:hypothetical protein
MKRFFLCLAFFLTACSYSNGFHRDRAREEAAGPPEITDASIQSALAKRPQLPKPFRLGIYFREPIRGLAGGYLAPEKTRFSGEEKAAVLDWARHLPAAEVRDVIAITEGAEQGADLRSIRLAAARHGADAVLVVGGASEESESANSLSLLNLLVAPAFFVHGSEVETLFVAHAALWDVRNEYLYLNGEAEAEAKRGRPLLFKETEQQAAGTRREALEKLRGELAAQFGALLTASR